VARGDLDPVVARAVAGSVFGAVPPESREILLADALRLDIPAGSVLYRDEDAARTGLVITGLVRVYLTSADGRQVTVRYARPGATLGVPMAVGGPVAVSAQAVTDSTLLLLRGAMVRSLAMADPRVAWPLAEEVTRLLYAVLDAFGGNVFGSVRQRVARHLLDLAAERQHGPELVAPVSQQALADAVGTAREVVARTLRDLREAGLVESTKRGVLLLDPDRLDEVATSGEL
jgi:CRP/FNR family transcriptional regulator, cyclic AMP receptor protein